MTPPAPLLDWKQLMDYSFVSEFKLLKHSQLHQDITHEPWAVPANRELTTKYFKVMRAHGEINRVNIKMCRLRTSTQDEHIMFEEHISHLQESNVLLAADVQRRYDTRWHVNCYHTLQLDAIEKLKGFAGICGPGTCHGAVGNGANIIPLATGGGPNEHTCISAAEQGNEWLEDGEEAGIIGAGGDDELNEQVVN